MATERRPYSTPEWEEIKSCGDNVEKALVLCFRYIADLQQERDKYKRMCDDINAKSMKIEDVLKKSVIKKVKQEAYDKGWSDASSDWSGFQEGF